MGLVRFKQTLTANCVACGRKVKWIKPTAAQLPLTNTLTVTSMPATVPDMAVIQRSLDEADQQTQHLNIGARPPRRDRDIDAAESEKDDKYFNALARGELDEAERKTG